jgi:hypothetical protein
MLIKGEKMLRKLLVTIVMTLGFCGQAAAEGYLGVNYSMVDLGGVKPTALELTFGDTGSKNAGVEVRIAVPLQADKGAAVIEEHIDFEELHFGVFGRIGGGGGGGEKISIFALAGFMHVEIEQSQEGAPDLNSPGGSSGLAFGIGLEAGKDFGLAASYLMGNGDLEDISWLSIGFFNRFE